MFAGLTCTGVVFVRTVGTKTSCPSKGVWSTTTILTEVPTDNVSRDRRWAVVRVAVSILLLGAASAKTFSVPEIVASEGLLSSLEWLSIVIGVEAAIAVYAVLAAPRQSWTAVTLLFSVFAGFAAYALVTQSNCQCFGDRLGARLTLPLDLAILAACWYCRPSVGSDERRSQGTVMLSVAIPLVVGGVFVQLAYQVSQVHVANNSQSLNFLLADMLTGKTWPLGETQHPLLDEMHDGKWLVLIVRSDCEHCRELVEREFAQPDRRGPFERTAVFVAGGKEWPFQFDRVSMDAASGNVISWTSEEPFVASPAVFCLSDGVVTSAADGTDADAFIGEFFSAIVHTSPQRWLK